MPSPWCGDSTRNSPAGTRPAAIRSSSRQVCTTPASISPRRTASTMPCSGNPAKRSADRSSGLMPSACSSRHAVCQPPKASGDTAIRLWPGRSDNACRSWRDVRTSTAEPMARSGVPRGAARVAMRLMPNSCSSVMYWPLLVMTKSTVRSATAWRSPAMSWLMMRSSLPLLWRSRLRIAAAEPPSPLRSPSGSSRPIRSGAAAWQPSAVSSRTDAKTENRGKREWRMDGGDVGRRPVYREPCAGCAWRGLHGVLYRSCRRTW